MDNKKLRGACLMKQTERHYKKKSCKVCGEWFQPIYAGEKLCGEECRKINAKQIYRKYFKSTAKERTRTCIVCREVSTLKGCGNLSEFCSDECALKAYFESDDAILKRKASTRLHNIGYNSQEIAFEYYFLKTGRYLDEYEDE